MTDAAPDRNAALTAYTRRLSRERWVWGQSDCLMIAATWWEIVTGIDPAADLRGTYSTAEEAEAILVREGGLLRFMGRRLVAHGGCRTAEPVAGDLAVIRNEGRHAAVICAGPRAWVGRPHVNGAGPARDDGMRVMMPCPRPQSWIGKGPAGIVGITGVAAVAAWKILEGNSCLN